MRDMATKKRAKKKQATRTATRTRKTKAKAKPIGATLTIEELLGGKPASSFEPSKLSGKAHWRWNKEQLFEAFLLFDASAQEARARSQPREERTSLNRAAVTLFRSKQNPDEARRRLREVVDHYRAHLDDTEDRHFTDWALSSLIEDEADRAPNATAFAKAYRAAVNEGRAILGDDRFPRIHVERLAEAAMRAGAKDIADEMLA